MRNNFLYLIVIFLTAICLTSCFPNKKMLYLKTENETGLKSEEDVRIKGYKIGNIDKVSITKDFPSLIRIHLDENIPIPTESIFIIEEVDLFGTKAINIIPSKSKPCYSYGDTLTVSFREKNMISDSISVKVERLIDTLAVELKKHQSK